MAGPSVVVRVLGDLKGLSGAVDDAASKGTGAAGRMRSAFSGMLSTLNASGVLGPFAGALEGLQTGLDQMAEHSGHMGAALMGVGGTATGVGLALSALGSTGKKAHEALKQSIENTGKSYADYADQIDKAAKRNEHFGYTTHTTEDALRILTQATGDPKKALDLLGTATDLAAAKNEDLSTAATQIGKAYNGAGKILKEFHITAAPKAAAAAKALATATRSAAAADDHAKTAKQKLTDYLAIYNAKSTHTVAEQQRLRDKVLAVASADAKAREAHEKMSAAQATNAKATAGQRSNMEQLAKAVHGQAEVAADSFSGKLRELTAKATDAATAFGEKFGPAITIAGGIITGLGGAIEGTQAILGLFKGAQTASTAATEGMTAAQTGAAASSWAMLGPILLVIGAIAALVLIAYVIYRNWKTIWKGIYTAVEFVWSWIKKNWPLLLAIIMGPIGIAALAIVRNFDKIKAAAKAVWDWVKKNWPLLLAIITGPIGVAALLVIRNWDKIKQAVAAVWSWIRDNFGRVLGWIRAPFEAAARIVRGAWEAVSSWFGRFVSNLGRGFSRIYDALARPFLLARDVILRTAAGIYNYMVGLPGKLRSAMGSMWNFLGDAFRGAINGLIDLWNRVHFDIPGFSIGPVHFGGQRIGVPYIPHLAQGGLITATGFVYAHAGEAITPAPDVGRTAPAVWIEQVTVAETLDVDVFLRRAAWAVQRERI